MLNLRMLITYIKSNNVICEVCSFVTRYSPLSGSSNAAKDMHCDTSYCSMRGCLSLIISTFNVLSLEFRKDCFNAFYGSERMDFLIVDKEYLDTDLNQ